MGIMIVLRLAQTVFYVEIEIVVLNHVQVGTAGTLSIRTYCCKKNKVKDTAAVLIVLIVCQYCNKKQES